MTNERAEFECAEFCPLPIRIRIGHEELVIRSLPCAIGLIRSLRHDRLGHFAEMLLAQMEAAETNAQKSEAWTAFRTWSGACGLIAANGPVHEAA